MAVAVPNFGFVFYTLDLCHYFIHVPVQFL